MDLKQEQESKQRREVYSNGLVIESKNGVLIATFNNYNYDKRRDFTND